MIRQLKYLLVWVAFLALSASAKLVPFLEAGFFFDYTPPGTPVPIPVTSQCQSIHLEWQRGAATGPSPVAPYFLQVYTSTFIVPFIIDAGSGLSFDWQVPFAPGTQYQICMFDTNGVSGGCQDKYTVIPNTTVSEPTCQNITFPKPMDVTATDSTGPLSQFGFVDQCTDITVTPKVGKPPFTLTIAPSLHPPYNLTSSTMDPIAWTVSVGRALPFYISMASSDGFMWSNGPLHSGLDNLKCYTPGLVPKGQAVGAGLGGLFGGAFFTAAVFVIIGYFSRRHAREMGKAAISYPRGGEEAEIGTYRSYPNGFPEDDNAVTSPSSTSRTDPSRDRSNHVYVVHHDGGRAPVTVYTRGADVTELPPLYGGLSESESGQGDSQAQTPTQTSISGMTSPVRIGRGEKARINY